MLMRYRYDILPREQRVSTYMSSKPLSSGGFTGIVVAIVVFIIIILILYVYVCRRRRRREVPQTGD